MKTNLRWIVLVMSLLLLVGTGCRRRDIRRARIYVPEMAGETCEQIIVNAVASTHGVLADRVSVNRKERTVDVFYDSILLSVRNLEFAVAEAGFRANDVPADAAARAKLPAPCRSEG